MEDHIIFRTTEHKKRLVRIMAARLGYVNPTAYMNALLDREFGKLAPEELATLLGETSPVVLTSDLAESDTTPSDDGKDAKVDGSRVNPKARTKR